jgi:predicted signal transduction protein with EAL and GGDEF domain
LAESADMRLRTAIRAPRRHLSLTRQVALLSLIPMVALGFVLARVLQSQIAIVRSTVDFARHLNLRVVAEGIESREVLERLVALGCDEGQGYLISRPVAAEALTARLSAERAEEAASCPPAAARGRALTTARSGT